MGYVPLPFCDPFTVVTMSSQAIILSVVTVIVTVALGSVGAFLVARWTVRRTESDARRERIEALNRSLYVVAGELLFVAKRKAQNPDAWLRTARSDKARIQSIMINFRAAQHSLELVPGAQLVLQHAETVRQAAKVCAEDWDTVNTWWWGIFSSKWHRRFCQRVEDHTMNLESAATALRDAITAQNPTSTS